MDLHWTLMVDNKLRQPQQQHAPRCCGETHSLPFWTHFFAAGVTHRLRERLTVDQTARERDDARVSLRPGQ
jgi:hypothetical protein